MNYHLICEDVIQVPLPLPFALRIVNCYLLRGAAGWTIVDTGLNTTPARAVWATVLAELAIGPGDVAQIVLTHTHPDHFGLAGWLQERLATAVHPPPPVYTSPIEAQAARETWYAPDNWEALATTHWQWCGMPEEMITAVSANVAQIYHHTLPHPLDLHAIEPGGTVRLGDRAFRAILTPGHSDGHLVFYDAANRLLLCGDHVLGKITPNISLWPAADPNPLGHYLATLPELRQLDVDLALPGHGPVITQFHQRLDELAHHHATRLADTQTAVTTPGTAHDIAQHLFDFTNFTVHEKRFAVAETLAHLEYLRLAGAVTRTNGAGVWLFEGVENGRSPDVACP